MKFLFKSKAHIIGIVLVLMLGTMILNKGQILSMFGDFKQLEQENEWRTTPLYQATYDTTFAKFITWQGTSENPIEYIQAYGGTAAEIVYAMDYGYTPAQLPEVSGSAHQKRIKSLAIEDAVRDYYINAYGADWVEKATDKVAQMDSVYQPENWFAQAENYFLKHSETGCHDSIISWTVPGTVDSIGVRYEVTIQPAEKQLLILNSDWHSNSFTPSKWDKSNPMFVSVFSDTSSSDYPYPNVPLGIFEYDPCSK